MLNGSRVFRAYELLEGSVLIPPVVYIHPRGYPRIASFTNSDSDSSLFRRFGDLYARTLLYKQAELTELEEKLAKIDRDDSESKGSEWKVSYSIHVKDGRKNEVRRDLMVEIKEKLKEYGKMASETFQEGFIAFVLQEICFFRILSCGNCTDPQIGHSTISPTCC
jgi:Family of unknown function (DUF6594)